MFSRSTDYMSAHSKNQAQTSVTRKQWLVVAFLPWLASAAWAQVMPAVSDAVESVDPIPACCRTPSGAMLMIQSSDSAASDAEALLGVDAAAGANNVFAVALFTELVATDPVAGNIVFSPMSIAAAFGMLQEGARGDSAAQIQDVFGFVGDAESTPTRGALLAQLAEQAQPIDDANTLRIVNQLWGLSDCDFRAAFLDATARDYGARLEACDFAEQPDVERERINQWVVEQTEDRIENLLPEGSVDSLTRLVLTNAVYFLGKWAQPFNDARTQALPFHLADGSAADVPTMYQQARFGYAQGDGFTAAELPFIGADLSMVVILPDEGSDVREVADRLGDWLGALDAFAYQDVKIFLPRFEFTAEYGLNDTLAAMGMTDVFSDAADLSGIGGSPGELFVSGVFHKAFIKVDESGAEAAAATGVVVGARSARPRPIPELRVDRPFLVLIRDTQSKAILFMGWVADPAG